MTRDKRTVRACAYALFLVLVILPVALKFSYAQQQQNVDITVAQGPFGWGVNSMTPAQLYSQINYVMRVKILDSNGKPISAASVALAPVGGIVQVSAKSSTGSDGIATMNVNFDGEGLVAIIVNGERAVLLTVFYSSSPVLGFAVPVIAVLGVLGLLLYTLYMGPIKWYSQSA